MDVVRLNQQAWDQQSRGQQSRWVVPVDSSTIDAAKNGDWSVILTPTKPVPDSWFGDIQGKSILGLASGGGQQMPVLAAAGAAVTSFDNSPAQLQKDALVAEQYGLNLTTVQGDMAHLDAFAEAQFDLVFHPVSNVFVPDVVAVWAECARVLKPGGRLLSGFMNPYYYLFDHDAIEAGEPAQVTHKLPYADIDVLNEDQIQERISAGCALEFSHSLDTQIQGQIQAGFVLHGFYEDHWDNEATPLNQYMSTSMATLAVKTVLI